MISLEKIQQLQEKSINVWPPRNHYFYNGWIIRLAEGVTSRANSLLPIRYLGSDLNKDIFTVEQIYQSMNLKPRFMLHDGFQPKNLLDVLKSLNYVPSDYSVVMGVKIANIKNIQPKKNEIKIEFSENKSDNWRNFKAKMSHRTQEEKKHINKPEERVLPVITKKYFTAFKNNDKDNIIAIALVFIDEQGYVHIADLSVDKKYRKQGVATNILTEIINWSKKNGYFIWLQVLRDNLPAINLYKKFNLTELYNYHYMTKVL